MTSFLKFKLLLWKNYLIQKRKPIATCFEIGIPTLLSFVLMIVRLQVSSTQFHEPKTWEPCPYRNPGLNITQMKLAFTPSNNATKRVMVTAANYLNMAHKGFPNEEKMVSNITSVEHRGGEIINNSAIYLGGIVFESPFHKVNGSHYFSKKISYKIRFSYAPRNSLFALRGFKSDTSWSTNFRFPPYQIVGPRDKEYACNINPDYQREGFLAVQNAINMGLMKEMLNEDQFQVYKSINVSLKRHPYPPYKKDNYVLVLQQQFPMIILLSLVVIVLGIVRDIVLEKERKLKESMKMMGINNWLHWLAWFTKHFLFLLISISIMTLFNCVPLDSKKGAVIAETNPLIIFIYLMCYALATISYCFAISVFVKKANTGAAISGIVFFCLYIPYFFLQQRYETMSFVSKVLACTDFQVAMAFGAILFGKFEGIGSGIQMDTLAKGVSVDDNFSMLIVLIMMLVDSLVLFLIAWYVEAVFPGEFGVPQPWCFPFMPSYWGFSTKEHIDTEEINFGIYQDQEMFEKEPNEKAGIEIRNLRKVFDKGDSKKVAVAGMTLNIFEGQITALLGHNGAGKTTTMSMLTGFYPPTSGTAIINGFNIRTEIAQVRESMGLCPQHDILFDNLTVEEHMLFFGLLKGVKKEDIMPQCRELLNDMQLLPKLKAKSKTLSGGMKRKLSVCIALIGNSKIIFLDEPSSGLDPNARRNIWAVLQKNRAGRTMVLSTHFMDEADLLGDRIAIMADGIIKCCGSSLFLKKKYGAGYHMVVVKQSSCDPERVISVVRSHIPQAEVESNVGAELSFVLPQECVRSFEALFSDMEENKTELGISSFGASVTTMEEVFLKVGEAEDIHIKKRLRKEGLKPAGKTSAMSEENHSHANNVVVEGTVNPVLSQMNSNHANVSTSESAELILNLQEDWDPETYESGGDNFNSEQHARGKRRKVKGVITKQSVPLDCLQTGKRCSDSSKANTLPTEQANDFNHSLIKNSGSKLYLQQFYAMFVKRMLHTFRNKLITITQLIVPLFFTTIGIVVVKTLPSFTSMPSFRLTADEYGSTFIPYANDTPFTHRIASSYAHQFKKYPSITPINVNKEPGFKQDPNITQFLIQEGETSISDYNLKYMFAGEYNSPESNVIDVTAFFNNQGFHTIAISLASAFNGIFQYLKNSTDYSIETYNHPLPPLPVNQINDELGFKDPEGFVIGFEMIFGMSFLASSFVLFLVKERSVKAKHVQFISGVHPLNFWFATFCWDLINYMIPCVLMILVFVIFSVSEYLVDLHWLQLILLFLLYGWSMLPSMYLFSFAFQVPATAYVWITMFNILTGSVAMLVVIIFDIPQIHLVNVSLTLEWVFLALFPNFCLGDALFYFYQNHEDYEICKNFWFIGHNKCCIGDDCLYFNLNYLGWEEGGIGRSLVFLSIQGAVFWGIIFALEFDLFKKVKNLFTRSDQSLLPGNVHDGRELVQEDDDVAMERSRIDNADIEALLRSNKLVLDNLTKYYDKLLAVDRISVGIPPGECFGLLGINGAGKTTTFKMLTGDISMSGGDAFIDAFSLHTQKEKARNKLGYCPQCDALIGQLTGRETLTLFARLRGVKESQIAGIVLTLLKALTLEPYADKQSQTYSGGNKRKLSTAIALIGDPDVIFLDEPTTGMDPVARRMLWEVLSRVRDGGKTLILTSHSMEECEALCTRLAIMVNGQFKCLGSIQHLKNKFGEGYTFNAKVSYPDDGNIPDLEPLKTFMDTNFPNCKLTDVHENMVNYHITDTSLKWSEVFGKIERARERLNLEDYMVSQTSLEQVFIYFARMQDSPDSLT